jgi:uridine kinase
VPALPRRTGAAERTLIAMERHTATDQARPAGRPGPAADGGLGALARRVAELPPSCGPVRLVGVDGHAGSGKSTFAAALAAALGGAPVVHLDDVATHEEFFAWTGRLRAAVLDPLARGADGWLPVYDWTARRFGPAVRVPCAPVVLVEGVGAGRAALRPLLAAVVWMDYERAAAWARGRRRDGPALDAFWDRWERAEAAHFAADPGVRHADLLVRERPGGYLVLPGPRGRDQVPEPAEDPGGLVTQGERLQSMRCRPEAGSA